MASNWRLWERPLLVPLARTPEFLCQVLAVHTGKWGHHGIGKNEQMQNAKFCPCPWIVVSACMIHLLLNPGDAHGMIEVGRISAHLVKELK